MTDLTKHVPAATMAGVARLVAGGRFTSKLCNLFISNVPGPQVPLYMAGAKLLHTYGMAPLADGMGLFIATPSYNGEMTFSIISAREIMPDIEFFRECLEASFTELLEAIYQVGGQVEYKDYYEIMGVKKDATQDEIKRSYRKLARKYHPDVSKETGAEAKFKEVGEAYEVLKDPEKRAAYDQLGSQWQAGQDFHPPPGWDAGYEFSGGGGGGPDLGGFSDFFESLYGRGFHTGGQRTTSGRGFQMRGEDHHAKVMVDLEDSYKGATRSITLQVSGVDESGRVVTRPRTLNVKIPKGIRRGQQIRLAGQGAPGHGGGEAGDLYLEVDFNLHKHYRVEGADVYLELPLAPWEAALGASVKVPTPIGAVDLKIPAGSQPGKKLRLKGRGIPARQPGDLYVELQIALPRAENEQQRKVYEDMKQEFSFNPRAGMET